MRQNVWLVNSKEGQAYYASTKIEDAEYYLNCKTPCREDCRIECVVVEGEPEAWRMLKVHLGVMITGEVNSTVKETVCKVLNMMKLIENIWK